MGSKSNNDPAFGWIGPEPNPDMFWAPINGGGGEKLSPPKSFDVIGAPKPPPLVPDVKSSPPRRSRLEVFSAAGTSEKRSNIGAAGAGTGVGTTVGDVGKIVAGFDGDVFPPNADEKSAKSSSTTSFFGG